MAAQKKKQQLEQERILERENIRRQKEEMRKKKFEELENNLSMQVLLLKL